MSRYIKKHRRYFAGVAIPVFLLFVIGAIGLSIFPGWIKPTYGTPGSSCVPQSTNSADPLLSACDLCAGEICSGTGFSPGTCSVGTAPCPDPLGGTPSCWANCNTNLDSTTLGTIATFFISSQCAPSDAACLSISGGTTANACRTATCTPVSTPDPANPSGCIYDLGNSANCTLCATPAPSTFNHCGNGVCEPGLGETCTSCAADCLLPGFTDTCPLTTGTTIGAACSTTITFDGPPFNQPGAGTCEDGDLCTDNACAAASAPLCSSTPKACSINNGDFCCPSTCNPPAAGGTCGANDSTCDIDCFTPQQCVVPSPTPTPIPTPPVFGLCINGGGISGNNGSLTCDGFSCTLNPFSGDHGTAYAWMLLVAAFGLGGAWALRRNES